MSGEFQIGVVIVAYRSGPLLLDCLDSLLAARGAALRIVVVDNASPDDTVALLRQWGAQAQEDGRVSRGVVDAADEAPPPAQDAITLLCSPTNCGFAGGVNLGLAALAADPAVEAFWILNPDCVSDPDTPGCLVVAARASQPFGIVGGRVMYQVPADRIQSDGGRVNLWTGTCYPFNLARTPAEATPVAPGSLDYVSGAHMLVSRDFYEDVGPMPEEYFLFYEEIDWCQRRGRFPIVFAPDAVVRHVGGATIGSATIESGPSPLASYYMTRNRVRFVARYRPLALPVAVAYAGARALRMVARGQRRSGVAALRGLLSLPPGRQIAARTSGQG